MQIKFEILKKGETILNVWENSIAVQKDNGDVEIYRFYVDEDNIPRVAENSLLITKGRGAFSFKSEDGSVEMMSY